MVNFTLVAGNMQDVFEIRTVNHTYGEVYVNSPLDRESVDRYLLKVRAMDNGAPPRFTDHSLTVNILDVNDNAPVVESRRGYNVSVSENVGGGTSVMRVVATDRDIGPNAMLFYYITAGNQDLTFRMDRMTGEMVTRPAPPDREHQQEYRLVVTVEDDGEPPLSSHLLATRSTAARNDRMPCCVNRKTTPEPNVQEKGRMQQLPAKMAAVFTRGTGPEQPCYRANGSQADPSCPALCSDGFGHQPGEK
ncbi:cadherin-23-like [Gadus chalcogrammus]|uniref:cadherin-23-like n=1 Tax=Gadus chalcogrammus TaxID=1042646 RepID=UPI0024C4D797|nr:cadherin-23-like [Gadus chalcogrammus]